jgi:ABC-type Fe3+-siderophore transport system permease subunit
MTILTRTLAVNATFSGMAGAVLAVGASPVSEWLGIPMWVSLLIGIGLAVFAVIVMRLAREPTRSSVVQVIGADVAWVVGAATVIVALPESMSTEGMWALATVSVLVALFVVLQILGLRRATVTV